MADSIMRAAIITVFISACLCEAAGGTVNFISAATLFSGPAAPVVDLGYASYRGKQDRNTKTANYLGLKFAEAP